MAPGSEAGQQEFNGTPTFHVWVPFNFLYKYYAFSTRSEYCPSSVLIEITSP